MVAIGSGLEIRDRTWLKIPIPMSFLGIILVLHSSSTFLF